EVLVVYILLGSVLAVHGGGSVVSPPSPANVATLANVSVTGWTDLLSTAPVVGDTGNLLVIPFLCGVAASALCMGLAIRAKTRWLAAGPLVILLAVGI